METNGASVLAVLHRVTTYPVSKIQSRATFYGIETIHKTPRETRRRFQAITDNTTEGAHTAFHHCVRTPQKKTCGRIVTRAETNQDGSIGQTPSNKTTGDWGGRGRGGGGMLHETWKDFFCVV